MVVAVLVLVLCMGSIAYYKVKYGIEEMNHLHCNAHERLHHMRDGESRASANTAQPNACELNENKNDIPMKRLCKDKNTTTTIENTPGQIKLPYILNNIVYNTILMELYQIVFMMIVIILQLTSGVVKNSLSPTTVAETSRVLLCFLDLAPQISASLVFPIMIHVRNPEIRKHIKRIFCNYQKD